MIYGFDIDDTINDCSLTMDREVLDFAKTHNLKIDYNERGYFCENRYGFSRENAHLFWSEKGADVYSKCSIVPGAAELIQRVKTEGNKVYFLTGRWEEFRNITEHTLFGNKIPFDDLIMGLSRKDITAKKLKLDYMFEDAEDYLSLLVGTVPNLYAKEQPHNLCIRNTEGVTFFKDWRELHI